MSPMKTWVVGEEVLAADFNTYVQKQIVAVFANAAARTAGFAAPPEGAVSYLADTDAVEVWNGTAWVGLGPNIGSARRVMAANNDFVNPTTATLLPGAADRDGASLTFVKRRAGSVLHVQVSATFDFQAGIAQNVVFAVTPNNGTTWYDVALRSVTAGPAGRFNATGVAPIPSVAAGSARWDIGIRTAAASGVRLWADDDTVSYTIIEGA